MYGENPANVSEIEKTNNVLDKIQEEANARVRSIEKDIENLDEARKCLVLERTSWLSIASRIRGIALDVTDDRVGLSADNPFAKYR